MKPFGNIVCPTNGQPKTFLKLCRYSELDEVEDRSIPTLVVGWEKAKKSINEANILQKWYPEQNVGWTFSSTERRSDYQKDITNFCEWLLTNVTSTSLYKQVDILRISLLDIKKFIRFIDSESPKFVFVDRNKFLFVYSRKYKRTYGISLSTCEYVGINKEKIIERILRNPFNERISNFAIIPYELRMRLGDRLHLYFSVLEYFT